MLDHHDVVLQGNMVVARSAAMRGSSSLLLFPNDGPPDFMQAVKDGSWAKDWC